MFKAKLMGNECIQLTFKNGKRTPNKRKLFYSELICRLV